MLEIVYIRKQFLKDFLTDSAVEKKLRTVPGEIMADTYQVTFSGKTVETTVTVKAADADAWVQAIRAMYPGQQIIVGLDCEWKPNRVPNMNNRTATLQLCVDTKCLILQLFYMDYVPQSLKSFLSDPNHVFVGVEVNQDVSKLSREYGLVCTTVSDIRVLAEEHYPHFLLQKAGLKTLAYHVAGLSIAKPRHVCMSNWQSRVLTLPQILYACIDAYASYKVAHKLLKEAWSLN